MHVLSVGEAQRGAELLMEDLEEPAVLHVDGFPTLCLEDNVLLFLA